MTLPEIRTIHGFFLPAKKLPLAFRFSTQVVSCYLPSGPFGLLQPHFNKVFLCTPRTPHFFKQSGVRGVRSSNNQQLTCFVHDSEMTFAQATPTPERSFNTLEAVPRITRVLVNHIYKCFSLHTVPRPFKERFAKTQVCGWFGID